MATKPTEEKKEVTPVAPAKKPATDEKIVADVQAAEAKAFAAKEAEAAKLPTPAANANADIATAIATGFKQSKEDSFTLTADAGVEPRFAVVKNKQGEVFLRENETGNLSRVQLESLEEKEASIQGQDVEEV